jgi:hypothetical protein
MTLKNNKRKRVLVQCSTLVDRNAVSRKSIGGVEHIVVSSRTLPDDIVMNGGLYPADEIAASFSSLERTLAPVEHPQDADGNFISATDPIAIHNYYAGAFNENVRQEDGRIAIDKVINVQEALKTDRGKRLLDRIAELETNSNPRPVHTSTGVFLEVEVLDSPQTNADGLEYTWIARNMMFDHDAILLESVAAAQPHQGVGMGVNRDGSELEVQRFEINTVKAAKGLPLASSDAKWDKGAALKRVKAHIGAEDAPNATFGRYHLWVDSENADEFGGYKLPFVDIVDGTPKAVPAALRNAAARLSQTQGPSAQEKTTIRGIITKYLDKLRANTMVTVEGNPGTEMSHGDIREALEEAVRRPPLRGDWIVEVFEDRVIFYSDELLFSAPYVMDRETARIVGIPTPVDRDVAYVPKTNQKGDAMKELMLKLLADAGVTVNADISDDDLLAKYNALQATQKPDDKGAAGGDDTGLADVVANALKPVVEKLDGLEAKINQNDTAEHDRLAEIVGNSDKFPGLDVEGAKKLSVDTLKSMAANCGSAYGVPLTIVNGGKSDDAATYEMPK